MCIVLQSWKFRESMCTTCTLMDSNRKHGENSWWCIYAVKHSNWNIFSGLQMSQISSTCAIPSLRCFNVFLDPAQCIHTVYYMHVIVNRCIWYTIMNTFSVYSQPPTGTITTDSGPPVASSNTSTTPSTTSETADTPSTETAASTLGVSVYLYHLKCVYFSSGNLII